jgi:ribonuclease T2
MKQHLLKLLTMSVGMWGVLVFDAQAQTSMLRGYVMEIQMVPAFCALDKGKNKKRKCVEGYSLNINGLYPDIAKENCQTTSSAALSPLQAKVLSRVMPDQSERTKLWKKYGGCVPMNASQYFRTIINYADRLNVPLELSAADDNITNVNALRTDFLRLNKNMPNQALHFSCQMINQVHVLTAIDICYSTTGKYKQCPKTLHTNCPYGFHIKGTF